MSSPSCSWTDNPSDGSLFPQYDSLIKPITDQQFISFHSINRELYSQLIFTHGRDAIESMQVMAFWLWLERDGYCPKKLILKIFHELPPHLVYQVADETAVCLKCIENDHFIYSVSEEDDDDEISFLQSLMERKSLSLVQLHEDRISIRSKVTAIVNETCFRAFKDILQNAVGGNSGTGVVNPDQASNSTSNRYGASAHLMPPPVMGANSGLVVVNPHEQASSSTSNRYTNLMPPPPVMGANSGLVVVNPHEQASSSTSNRYTNLMPPPVMRVPVYPRQLVGFMEGPTRYLANDGGGGHELMTSAMGVPTNQMVVPLPPNQMIVVTPPQGQNDHFNPYEHLQHHHQQGGEQETELMHSHFNPYDLLPQQVDHLEIEGGISHFNPCDFRREQNQLQQMEVLNRKLEERMSHVHISDHHPEDEVNEEVQADDRTIFLTFSKGYPISENEVREFFTRRYGDFIEGIYMQEVAADEQSLFARVVVRNGNVSAIERVAPRGSKAKFVINGKHVWARKYVKKTSARLPLQGTGGGPSQSSSG